jgi:glycosyltransferase involved in cell wall biosynthesis
MTNVLLLTRYERLGASSRIRFLQFLPSLERHGFTFDVSSLLDDAYVASLYGGLKVGPGNIMRSYARRFSALRRQARYDLIWLEKEALPWFPTWMEIPNLRGTPYVVDYDDAWFHRYESHFLKPLLGHKIDAVMRAARTVVVGNDYLARHARQSGAAEVEIVPTTIDLDRYSKVPEALSGEPLKVGWIGIPLNVHYLGIIEPALLAASKCGRIELHVVGARVPPALGAIPAKSFGWSEDTEVSRIAQFDVGVMPLHDTPWERGKCAYKLLQVMAAGRPVIASPVGANRQVVRHGINGFLAETTAEWTEALSRLADPVLRQRMGLAARKTVEEQYSTAIATPRLAAILSKAAHGCEARGIVDRADADLYGPRG